MPVESSRGKWRGRVGYALTAAAVLVLLRSAWMKLIASPGVVEQVVEGWGYPPSALAGIGLLELTCVLVYAVPRTAVLGAVLLTGYLGGAVATHVRIGEPFAVPLAVGAIVWAGLYLRDDSVRGLVRRMVGPRRGRQVFGRSHEAASEPRRTSMSASRSRAPRWEAIAERFSIFAMHRELYRALGGRFVGRNILILTTTGRRTGRRRSTPLYYVRDGEDYIVIASNGGDDWYPGWWYNILANPDVEIEVGRSRIPCKAERVSEADGRPLFAKLTGVYAGYARYEQRTTRELTLFRLRARALRP